MATGISEISVVGFERAQYLLSALPDEVFSKKNLNQLGLFFTFAIKKRTAEGKDVNGAFFAPYTADYADFRMINGHQEYPVNLFFTGSMMNAMTFEAGNSLFFSEHTIRIFFRDTQDRKGASNPLKAAGLNKKREFFNVSQEELEKAAEILRSKI